MQIFKLGDKVSVLHETLTGTVIQVGVKKAKIEDPDGFIWDYPFDELVLQVPCEDYAVDESLFAKDHVAPVETSKKSLRHNRSHLQKEEIDLHIEELRDEYTHLSNSEIVQIQMTACRSFIQESMAQNRKKVVVIHGKGQGVLKSEIRSYLNRLSNHSGSQLEYHDASYQEYGMGGATEVVFYG